MGIIVGWLQTPKQHKFRGAAIGTNEVKISWRAKIGTDEAKIP